MNITHRYVPMATPSDPFAENSAENATTLRRRAAYRQWIINVCKGQNVSLPEGTIILWFDGTPRQIYGGKWKLDSDYVYVGQTNPHAKIPPGWAPAAMWAIAHYWGFTGEEEINNLLSSFTAMVVLKTYKMAKAAAIGATVDGEPLVVFATKGENLATYVRDKWYLPTGEETAIDNTWVTFGLNDTDRPNQGGDDNAEEDSAEAGGDRGDSQTEESEEAREGVADSEIPATPEEIEEIFDQLVTGDEFHDDLDDWALREGASTTSGDIGGDESVGVEPPVETLHQPTPDLSQV